MHQVKVPCFTLDPSNTGDRLFTTGLRLGEHPIPGGTCGISGTWQKMGVNVFKLSTNGN